jgi:hypothetical protein
MACKKGVDIVTLYTQKRVENKEGYKDIFV